MPRRAHFRYTKSDNSARDPVPSAPTRTKPAPKARSERKTKGSTERDSGANPTGPEGNDDQADGEDE